MLGYNNRARSRLVANKETSHNIYYIKRGGKYINTNSETIIKNYIGENKDTINTQ